MRVGALFLETRVMTVGAGRRSRLMTRELDGSSTWLRQFCKTDNRFSDCGRSLFLVDDASDGRVTTGDGEKCWKWKTTFDAITISDIFANDNANGNENWTKITTALDFRTRIELKLHVEKLLHPKGSRMMPPSGLQIYLRPFVTLTFDLLNLKVDRLVPLVRGPRVPICFKLVHSCSKYRILNIFKRLTLR